MGWLCFLLGRFRPALQTGGELCNSWMRANSPSRSSRSILGAGFLLITSLGPSSGSLLTLEGTLHDKREAGEFPAGPRGLYPGDGTKCSGKGLHFAH